MALYFFAIRAHVTALQSKMTSLWGNLLQFLLLTFEVSGLILHLRFGKRTLSRKEEVMSLWFFIIKRDERDL